MNEKLEKLLIDWKCAGFVDSSKEWQAIEDYLWQQQFNEQVKDGKGLTPQVCADQFRMYGKNHPIPDREFTFNFCADFLEEFCVPLWNKITNKN